MNKLSKAILSILLVTAGLQAQAADVKYGVHLATYHFDRERSLNEVNPGLYIRCNGWTLGGYKSSVSKPSFYFGYTAESGPFALTVGAIKGYADGVRPMLVPSVHVGAGFRVAYIPQIPGNPYNNSGLHLLKEF
jgi:hypothetical protein